MQITTTRISLLAITWLLIFPWIAIVHAEDQPDLLELPDSPLTIDHRFAADRVIAEGEPHLVRVDGIEVHHCDSDAVVAVV